MFDSDKTELEFYRKLLSKMNASIYILDFESYALEWVTDNSMLQRILGLSLEEVMLHRKYIVARVLSSPDFQESVELAQSSFDAPNNPGWTGVFRIKNDHGLPKWIIYSMSSLDKDKNEKTSKAIVVAFDSGNLLSTPKTLDAFLKQLKSERHIRIKESLTKKQCEVLLEVSRNKTEKQISEKLGISVHTVKDHKKLLYKKLNCNSTKELFAIAQNYEFFT